MKKTLALVGLLAIVAAGCQSKKSKADDENQQAVEKTITKLDSVVAEIDKAQAEVEETAKKLDELVNELK